MKCHYEVLEVTADADDSEIKTAYRKLALKWHPDKNLDNPEHAKEQFQLLQQAYEVLSDRQERAWYDRHREQILRGSNSNFEDNSLDVFQYFTSSCFKGYGDDENGFYTVYNNVFEQLAKEDMEFMDKEEFMDIPKFGSSSSDYNEIVAPFYAYWMSYSTRKSFAWLDPYNIKETRDRRVVKLIEKENKKVRQKAKKERNEEIRALVAFVRKRDKRAQNNAKLMLEKTLVNREKQKNLRKQKLLESHKKNASNSQAEWTKFDNVKSELEEIEKHLAEQFGEELSNSENELEETETDNNLYCVACNKIFKTPKAFANHESSKKHKEKVAALKLLMEEEEDDIDDDDDDDEENLENCEGNLSDEDDVSVHSDQFVSEEEEIEMIKPKVKKKNKKSKSVIKTDFSSDEVELDIQVSLSDATDDMDFNTNTKVKKKTRKSQGAMSEEKLQNSSGENTNLIEEKPETKERKQKRDKKSKRDISETDTQLCCVTCNTSFPSKNKLFDHLKKTNHGVALNSKSKKKSVS